MDTGENNEPLRKKIQRELKAGKSLEKLFNINGDYIRLREYAFEPGPLLPIYERVFNERKWRRWEAWTKQRKSLPEKFRPFHPTMKGRRWEPSSNDLTTKELKYVEVIACRTGTKSAGNEIVRRVHCVRAFFIIYFFEWYFLCTSRNCLSVMWV